MTLFTARLLQNNVRTSLKSIRTTNLSTTDFMKATVGFMATTATINIIVPSSSNTISVTNCQSENDDDKSEDIVSKIKNIAGGNFDWNKGVDRLGQDIGAKVQQAVDTGIPTQISYGFVCGYSSGYALKKIGKAMSVAFGLGFITLQTLSYSGYVQVNHEKLKEGIENILDLNDDGKVDGEDVNMAKNKLLSVLSFNMPAGGGFGSGFLGGFRSG